MRKFKDKIMVKRYKDLAFGITFIDLASLICMPDFKKIITYRKRVAFGYSVGQFAFYFVIIYILDFLCIFMSILNYRYLINNNLTKHSKAKQLYAYLTPILTFIAIILMGIFV